MGSARIGSPKRGSGPVFYRTFDRSLTTAEEFWRTHKFAMFALLAFYGLALFGTFQLKRYLRRAAQPATPQEGPKALEAPFSVALLVVLLGTGGYLASAPIGIAMVFYSLYLIPMLRLLVPLSETGLSKLLYVLSGFYSLEGLSLLVQLPPLFKRGFYALIILSALVSLGWLASPSRADPSAMQSRGRRIFVIGVRLNLVLLAAALVTNIFGFVSLAQVLGMTAFVGPFIALAFYCGVRVLTFILSTLLHTDWARALLETRTDMLERWGGRVLALAAVLSWLKAMLHLLTLYDGLLGAVSKLLQHPIGFESLHFTLGGALGVVLILVGGYALANALTFLLTKAVLPKLRLQRGVPYAISTVTYYFLLLLVALATLSGAGVELNKFTVLTGALGVGLGFGLQNVVNNFVSGLILLFEHPIHIGDTVDVGGFTGIVRRIGARSSTILTPEGAELIVPNSNLLSNQVINWTLWRRVDVPVRVAYGTDPERVIQLLVGVAESRPGVRLEQPPTAFFMGFGESGLNFELRFWAAHNSWFQTQSDVSMAVARTLREAGIAVPFPQRDLHVRTIGASVVGTLATNSVRAAPSDGPRTPAPADDAGAMFTR